MKNLGLKNPALAEKVGCKPVEIWRLAQWPAKGGRQMTPAWAEKLAPHLGIKPHELLFDYAVKEAVDIAEHVLQKRVPVVGACIAGHYFKKEDEPQPDIESNIPKLPGKYWGYDQFAYRIIDTPLGFGPLSNDFVICINYHSVRRNLIDGDMVVVEKTENQITERILCRLTSISETRFVLMPWQIPYDPTSGKKLGLSVKAIDLPTDNSPDVFDFVLNNEQIEITSLVIGRLKFEA